MATEVQNMASIRRAAFFIHIASEIYRFIRDEEGPESPFRPWPVEDTPTKNRYIAIVETAVELAKKLDREAEEASELVKCLYCARPLEFVDCDPYCSAFCSIAAQKEGA